MESLISLLRLDLRLSSAFLSRVWISWFMLCLVLASSPKCSLPRTTLRVAANESSGLPASGNNWQCQSDRSFWSSGNKWELWIAPGLGNIGFYKPISACSRSVALPGRLYTLRVGTWRGAGTPVLGVVSVHRVIIPVDRPKSAASRRWGTPKKRYANMMRWR